MRFSDLHGSNMLYSNRFLVPTRVVLGLTFK